MTQIADYKYGKKNHQKRCSLQRICTLATKDELQVTALKIQIGDPKRQ